MKKLMICCIFSLLLFSCKKNNLEEPCSDQSTLIKLKIDFPSIIYRHDSLKIVYKGALYPFSTTWEDITIQFPPEAGVNDTLYLDWWNVPDRDTVVLEYKLSDEPCKTFEYEHAWFNGEYYRDFGNASQTFFFTKK